MLQLQLVIDEETYQPTNTDFTITENIVNELSDMMEWALEKKRNSISLL